MLKSGLPIPSLDVLAGHGIVAPRPRRLQEALTNLTSSTRFDALDELSGGPFPPEEDMT